MDNQAVHFVQTILGLVLFGFIAKWYVIPAARKYPIRVALVPLLMYSAFRYFGTNFLVPEITNGLPDSFTSFAARGDLAVGILALVAAVSLQMRWGFGIHLAWAYAILGLADFAYAFSKASQFILIEKIGASWPVTYLLGPAWIVTCIVILVLLVKKDKHPTEA